MRAVMPSVPSEILAWRRLTGADRRDEKWEGGWLRSNTAGIEMRATASRKLAIRVTGNGSTRQEIPQE